MDSLASLTYLPLRFAGNQLAYTVDAAPESITDRSGLTYFLCVKKPRAYQSGEFTELITLPGREEPPVVELGASYLPGAPFDIAVYVGDSLQRIAPRPNQTDVDLCGELIMPYYVQSWVENNGVLVADSTTTGPLEYALRGRLSTEQYAVWRSEFFTTYLAQTRGFLTWQPVEKWVETNQPEFLYFLVNFTPKPTELRLRVAITFSDGSVETLTRQTVDGVNQYTVYGFPVGFTALGLADRESVNQRVHSYQVWLANESDLRLSEVRTFYLNADYEHQVLFLLFANSLGGYDTLRCSGQTTRALAVKGTLLATSLETNYGTHTAELVSLNRLGERTLTVNTGLMDGPNLDYLSELALSDEIYLVTAEGFVALVPADGSLALRADDDDLAGRSLSFRYAKNEVGYSNLPAAPQTPARPTKWAPINPYCLIDENGLRTGLIASATLELRFVDDDSVVKPRRTKPNLPGTVGYVGAFESSVCDTTPYVNALVTKPGKFRRSNCGSGQEGTLATLTIPAGTYGAENPEQLQSRIDQALLAMDTQAFANQYGSCLANPAAYTVSVPGGHFHYRGSAPARLGIYLASGPVMGNTWQIQGTAGAYVFAQGSNDLDFPSTYDPYYWRLFVYGPASQSFRLRVYMDNVLKKDKIGRFNSSGYELLRLFSNDADVTFAVASGAKVYLLLTDEN